MRKCFESGDDIDPRELKGELMSILYDRGATESDFQAAELICAELIGNAKRHATGRVTVELKWQTLHPVLTVHDESDSFVATMELPADLWAQSGRGLYLVKRLAHDFRVVDIEDDGCKAVATLPVDKKAS